MKKIFLIIITILCVQTTAISADNYALGVKAFNNSDFKTAEKCFEQAIVNNPYYVNARYYLAQCYIKQKRTNDAKEQYKRIIVLAPSSAAAQLSTRGLYLIRQAELGIYKTPDGLTVNDLKQYSDNYLSYVMNQDGTVSKWENFPLTVYIENKPQKEIVKKAFNEWQNKSKNLVTFKFVNTKNAKITVSFKNKLEDTSSQDSYIAGYSKPYFKDKKLDKSEILLLVVDPQTGEKLEDSYIYFSALHEIGHTLGFKGHSPQEADVMASSATEPKSELTKRDINTLNVFYRADEKMLLARTSLASTDQLKQAKAYAEKNPEKSVGWSNLGDIYRSKKMYGAAVSNYQKAISLEPKKAELYNLLGSAYEGLKEKDAAFDAYKKACDLDKNNLYFVYQFAKFCLTDGNKALGRTYINDFVSRNPDSVNDEKIKSLQKSYK